MSQPTVLDRQIALLKYLTDPLAYGGATREQLLVPDRAINGDGLAFLGRGGFGRRANKVRSKLRATASALGDDFFQVMNEFAHLVRPDGTRGVEVAEQFQGFLESHCEHLHSKKPFLRDLCRVEVAMARVARPEEELPYLAAIFTGPGQAGRSYRIIAGCEAVECAHDIRPLFDHSVKSEILPRIMLLGVFYSDGKLRVMEVAPPIFSLLNFIKTRSRGSFDVAPECDVESISLLEQLNVIEAA